MTDLQRALAEDLDYNPETGVLTWKRGKLSGRPAGGKQYDGYVFVKLGPGLRYTAHTVIWAIMTGAYPTKPLEVDHINRIRDDNRWVNLRLVTSSQNHHNNNAAGVTFDYRRSKWKAYIKINRKQIHLGCFNTYEEAKQARNKEHERILATIGDQPIHQ